MLNRHPLTKTQITWAGSGINKTTRTIGHVTEVAIETMTTENAGDRGTGELMQVPASRYLTVYF